MHVRSALFALVVATPLAAAQPAPEPPPAALPPITITITNNNNGNNSNTNTQTNTAPVTVSTPEAAHAMPPPPPPPGFVERYELHRDHAPSHRWLAVGMTSELHRRGGMGARASLDLIERGAFDLGIAGELGGRAGGRREHGGGGTGDGSAVAYVAWTRSLGRLDLRAEVGLGVGTSGASRDRRDSRPDALARTTSPTPTSMDRRHGDALAPRAEAALLVGLPLTRHLGVVAGPELTASGVGRDHQVAVEAFAGLRYRL